MATSSRRAISSIEEASTNAWIIRGTCVSENTDPPRALTSKASLISDTSSKPKTAIRAGPTPATRALEILYAGWYAPTQFTYGSAATDRAVAASILVTYAAFATYIWGEPPRLRM